MARRPMPNVSELNRFYWTAGRDGVLSIMRCRECQTWLHPVKPICSACRSDNVAPADVEGTGTVYSVTVNHQPWVPGLQVPYAIARVALDGVEGVLMTTNIVGEGALETAIGDRVEVRFEEQDGVWFPIFARAQSAQADEDAGAARLT